MSSTLNKNGFTIVELLISLFVVGILITLALVTFSDSRNRAETAKAETEINLVQTGVLGLQLDLGKWPNGCSKSQQPDPAPDIELDETALSAAPEVGTVVSGCAWTSADVDAWKGPYVDEEVLTDAWENTYVFDPEYVPWENCATQANEPEIAAVVSYGPDGIEASCDDIYRWVSN